jgi:hypothetical protein
MTYVNQAGPETAHSPRGRARPVRSATQPVAAIVLILALVPACRADTSGSPSTASRSAAETEPGMDGEGFGLDLEEFDAADFDQDSIDVDNQWWPLTARTQYVYEGFTVEDGDEIPHRIVFTVTDLTKEINGVRTVVVYERDFSDDLLEEAELAFFAQDREGNVWHFGQYRETYDEVEFVGGRVWLVGYTDGAQAGIMMHADPQAGSPDYSQGYAPAPFNWTDRARVDEVGAETSVAYGDYDDVLVIEEYNDEEPGAFQLKYYASGVGNVRVGWRGDDSQQEELELVDVIQLEGDALAAARDEALQLEARAYSYALTAPAEIRASE